MTPYQTPHASPHMSNSGFLHPGPVTPSQRSSYRALPTHSPVMHNSPQARSYGVSGK